MVFTVALLFDEKAIFVWDDGPKVAVSVGTTAGSQLAAVFHSPVFGWVPQVESPSVAEVDSLLSIRFTSGDMEFKREPFVPFWNAVYVALRVVVKGM